LINSFEKRNQNQQEEEISTYRTGKFEGSDNEEELLSSGREEYHNQQTANKDPILTIQEYETEYKKSPSMSRQNTSTNQDTDAASRFDDDTSYDERSNCSYHEGDHHQQSGIVSDINVIFEGKPFVVVSRPNDIHDRRMERDITTTTLSDWSTVSASKRKDVSSILKKYEEEAQKARMQISGLRDFQNEVSDLVKNLNKKNQEGITSFRSSGSPYVLDRPKYREIEEVSPEKPQESNDQMTDISELFRKRIHSSLGQSFNDDSYHQRLVNSNSYILETDDTPDFSQYESVPRDPHLKSI